LVRKTQASFVPSNFANIFSKGYAVFEVVAQPETIGNRLKEVQDAHNDLAKFGKMIRLVNFTQWTGGAGQALDK